VHMTLREWSALPPPVPLVMVAQPATDRQYF